MMIIRPMQRKDLPFLMEFSNDSTLGMTNLPHDKFLLEQKIMHSEDSFKHEVSKPDIEEYYFVLEESTTGLVGGTCGILAHNSLSRSYFYTIREDRNDSSHQAAPKIIKTLHVVMNTNNASEICSLYLHPNFRHGGLGKLLSLSRFLFIAGFKHRFNQTIAASLRGYQDQYHSSPFWEHVGRHFCNLTFVNLLTNLEQDKTLLIDHLPRYPIYIELLPNDVQEVIGKPHEGSKPALAMLLEEGFNLNNEVDLLDAGPMVEANINSIRSIKMSRVVHIQTTSDLLSTEIDYIIGNEKIDFRACLGKIKLLNNSKALINESVAEALCVVNGDKIRFIPPH